MNNIFDDSMSNDYMAGFLMGKALNSQKAQSQQMPNNIEMSDEETKRVDALLTREMDKEILRRLAEKQGANKK